MPFDIYPAVDEDHNFPPEVRSAMAAYAELIAAFAPKSLETSKEDAIELGNTSQYWRGNKQWATLDKAAIGMPNLDNTSDANKPLSIAAIALPKGLVWQEKLPADSPSTGATKIVANYVPTFTFLAGRKYKLHWSFEFSGTELGNAIATDIQTCSTADVPSAITGLTKIGGSSLIVNKINTGHHGEALAYLTPTTNQTFQIKFILNVWSGAGLVLLKASSTNPTLYSIIDEGAQF